MANALYGLGREHFLDGSIAWGTDDIKCVLVDTGTYSVSIDTHEFHDALSGIVDTSGNLGTKTVTLGTADAADVTFTAVSGSTVEALVIYKDTGNTATSPLIAYIDTATGLPVTPNGGDITITWDSGSDKIFTL
jgi:hypothetical protein